MSQRKRAGGEERRRLAIAVSNDRLCAKLACALEHEEWVDRPEFAGYEHRGTNRENLRAAIESALSGLTTSQGAETRGPLPVGSGTRSRTGPCP